jgi:hypothetical protein
MRYFNFSKEQKFWIHQFKKVPFIVGKLDKFDDDKLSEEEVMHKHPNYQNCFEANDYVFEHKLSEIREFFKL